ncbi:hypothetical protein [Candidatus Fukatsuia endosymbiont of Tuberolachnus salignus]|uniref:hypothetical protein n=1 Tax=Candidatus Fukatsuia endosymbiont of Tuberolachnus salignus TaxID=3077957 RepID=UPI00313C2DE8
MQKQTLVTALTTWIDQQQKTGLNLASRITELNRLKDNYNNTATSLSGSEEMKHLIKLLANVSETYWSKVQETIQKSLLERIKAIKIPLAADEKTLHFFLTETNSTHRHQDINNWMTAYPDYNIRIWTDDSFHSSTQIFNRLQTQIGVDLDQSLANYGYDVAKTLEILMLNKRRYAHSQISSAMQIKITDFREKALSDYITANPNVLSENERNRIKHSSLPDFLNSLSLSQDKIDELRATVLSDYIKTTFNLSDDEITRINTAYSARAQDLVSALQVRHRDGNVTIEHKKVIINDGLNSPYLNRLILTANQQQAIHTIGLSILKEQGGVFINTGGKVNSTFDHLNHLKVDPLLGAAYSKNLKMIIAKKDSQFINALFTREEKIKTILAAFPDIEKGITPSQTGLSDIKARLNRENLVVSVDELASYAYETLRNPSYTDVTDFFAGERGYFDVFKQQIQIEIGTSLKEKPFLPLIVPCIKGMTMDPVATEVDPGPSMIASKNRFAFKPNVTGHTNYTRQIVIQLTEDQAVNASAMALHRKNKAISSLYR